MVYDMARANRLDDQSSPYLQAHASDPVEWRPWSRKTFAEAANLDRPIMLSVGYQSCHWCHVMQRESFRDTDTAKIINSAFIPVKVDREIRPDVDAFYMAYVQASTGSGGWPLTAFLTPDGLPLFGGTYFPKRSSDERLPSFREVLETVRSSWVLSRTRAQDVAKEAMVYLASTQASASSGGPIDRALLDEAARKLMAAEDPREGGFGGAPKFPQAPLSTFLIAYSCLTGDERPARAAMRATLAMVRGGIYDQVGGGLFRYSTDARWFVPHFEKMLYDQGLLLSTLAALQPFASPGEKDELAFVARQIVAFLDRDLALDKGGYASSLDAETGGVEGGTYLWTHDELAGLLEPDELELCERFLGVTSGGTYERNSNILTRRSGREAEGDDGARVDKVLQRLLEARALRDQPTRIDNVIVSWNALVARGLIEAGMAFGDGTLLERGLTLVDWLEKQAVWRSEVLHALGDASVAKVRLLEDTAALCAALLSAHESGNRPRASRLAVRLHEAALARFTSTDGLAMSVGDIHLPLVPVETDDSPVPSGAALSAENALRIELAGLSKPGSDGIAKAADILRQYSRTAVVAPALAGHALAVATRLPLS